MGEASTIMAKKSATAGAPPKTMGRPKGSGRVTSRFAIVATPEYRAWLDEFMKHAGETEVSDAFREGMKRYADSMKFRSPPKR